jgi:hypothetical protein
MYEYLTPRTAGSPRSHIPSSVRSTSRAQDIESTDGPYDVDPRALCIEMVAVTREVTKILTKAACQDTCPCDMTVPLS